MTTRRSFLRGAAASGISFCSCGMLDADHDQSKAPRLAVKVNGKRVLTADVHAHNLRTLIRRRIEGYVATGRQKHGTKAAATKRKLKSGTLIARMSTKRKRAGYRSRYRLRKQIVEPVFGQIKQARGFRQFLLRSIDKVKAEWAMICTAHNLAKLAAAR